jgi:hypothetical protein
MRMLLVPNGKEHKAERTKKGERQREKPGVELDSAKLADKCAPKV